MSTIPGSYGDVGATMLLIALVACAGVGILVERLFVIVLRGRNNGRMFIDQLVQLVRGARIDDAIRLCARSTAAVPDVGLLILRSRSRDETDLQNVANAASLSVVPRLTRRLQY